MKNTLRPFVIVTVLGLALGGLAASPSGAVSAFAEPARGPFVDVGAAPVVVVGVASHGRSLWAGGQVVTLTPFRVEQALRGNVPSEITIRTLGGQLPNGLVQVTQHEPVFAAGRRSRLFLEPQPEGDYSVRGAEQGKQDDGSYRASQTCGASFCPTGQRWPTSAFPLVYQINANSADLTGEESAVAAGIQRWEDDPGSAVDVTNGGATSVAVTGMDGVQAVYWLDSGDNFLGRATWFFDASGVIFHFDIELNDRWFWSVAPASPNDIDVESVVIHEMGHALGLDHTDDAAQIMFPTLQSGSTKRTLGSGDMQGIASLYPGTGTPPPPGMVPPQPPTGSPVTLNGTAFKVSRSGSTKGLKKTQVCAMGTVTVCFTTARGGVYTLTLPPGTYSVSATRRRRQCHSQSTTGPGSPVTQTLTGSATLDWFCVKP